MRIWTIGHSTRMIEKFISLLEEHGIKLLADVRLLPGSKRYPQFNKETLADSLAKVAICYEHFPELGGRRKPREDSPNTAWRNESFRGYADYMETEEFNKGVKRLLDLAADAGPAAIMCAEAVWWRCHRYSYFQSRCAICAGTGGDNFSRSIIRSASHCTHSKYVSR